MEATHNISPDPGSHATATAPQRPPPAVPTATTPQPPSIPLITTTSPTIPLGGSVVSGGSSGPNTSHSSSSPSATASAAPSQPSLQTTIPASTTPSPVPPSAASLPPPPNSSTQLAGEKSVISKVWALKALLYAILIVAITDALTLTAASPSSPLGSIGYSNGVLVLSILQMLTGYSLAVAAKTAWDRVRFLILLKHGEQGQNLLVFWTLSTDIGGCLLIFWREFCQLLPFRRRRNTRSVAPQLPANIPSLPKGHPRIWSVLRVISWAIMQFPGVIIMTVVNSKTSYVPIKWTAISGGIGRYDPSLAIPDADPILTTISTLDILQDTRRAIQIDPINDDCISAGDSCKSYLIPGGLDSVSPWPYQILDASWDIYMTKEEPTYQIDFWNPPDDVKILTDGCEVYSPTEDAGFQLCTSPYAGGSSQIIAGWTPCTSNLLPSGECSQNGSWGAYVFSSTILSISRRTATVSMLRETGEIVAWENLSEPELQNITAADFKSAFDVIFVPWQNGSSTIITPYDYNWLLTNEIGISLFLDLDAPFSTKSQDLLHNLFATPLYVFTPVILKGGPDVDVVQPYLLPENYFNGSYARTRIHAVPQRWTVLTYVGVSGLLLLMISMALALSARYEGPESSMFPFVDELNLRWVREGNEVESMRQVFQNVDLAENEMILDRAGSVRVKLRT